MLNQETKKILNKAVILPLLLKVLQGDKKLFQDFKMKNVYLDKLDVVIESVQTDLNQVKQLMYSVHHIDLVLLSQEEGLSRYQWKTGKDTGLLEFSSAQLREQTRKCMEEYLYGSLAKPYEPQRRAWY